MRQDILEYYENNDSFKAIIGFFSKEYKKAFSSLKNINTETITELTPHIFRKWYYSPLKPNSSLSPANIINSYSLNKFGCHKMIVPSVEIKFKSNKLTGVNYYLKPLCLEDHYVIHDLKKLIEICTPDIELYEDNNIMRIKASELIDSLTFRDYGYVTYLTAVAFDLKLIRKMPSIHTIRAFVPGTSYDFFELDPQEQLKKIVKSSINLYSNELHNLFLPFGSINFKGLIQNFFVNSFSIQKLYEKLFSLYGINLNEIIEDKEDKYFDLKESISVGLFFLSIITEMWLICPFGYYLQLIQPLYEKPFDMTQSLNEINVQGTEVNIDNLFLTPCDYYDLTSLGEKYFFGAYGSAPNKSQQLAHKEFEIEDYLKYFR